MHSDTPKEKRKRQKCEFEVNRSRNPLLVVSEAPGLAQLRVKEKGPHASQEQAVCSQWMSEGSNAVSAGKCGTVKGAERETAFLSTQVSQAAS